MMYNVMWFFWPFFMFVWIFVLLGFIFWLWMLIDCLKRRMDKFDKLIWILVLIFLHILGAILYYLLVKRRK